MIAQANTTDWHFSSSSDNIGNSILQLNLLAMGNCCFWRQTNGQTNDWPLNQRTMKENNDKKEKKWIQNKKSLAVEYFSGQTYAHTLFLTALPLKTITALLKTTVKTLTEKSNWLPKLSHDIMKKLKNQKIKMGHQEHSRKVFQKFLSTSLFNTKMITAPTKKQQISPKLWKRHSP